MERHLILLSSAQETVAQVRGALEPLKYRVTVKGGISSGIKEVCGEELIFLDFPDSVKSLRELKSYCPEATVLVSSDRQDSDLVMAEGAYLCLERPLDSSALKAAVRNASDSIALKGELERLKGASGPKLVLGVSPAMETFIGRIRELSGQKVPVLIHGERGTGKARVAEYLHYLSPRSNGPFVQMSCHGNNFNETFFGSDNERGRALSADGGTILIRNIHSLDTQSARKLARFFETGMIEQAGGQMVHVDVRVVATARDLPDEEAPLCRLLKPAAMPALRERRDDILQLAGYFLDEAASFVGSGCKDLSREAADLLLSHSWPGNVSELKGTVRRACLLSKGGVIEPSHITHDDGTAYCSVKDFLEAKLSRFIKGMVKLERSGLHESVMNETEKALIEIVLEETGGNQLRAAHTLGITRTTLRNKIKNYGIKTAFIRGRSRAASGNS